jgi:hypothetical protein
MAMLLIGLMLFTSAGGSIGGNGIDALFLSQFGVQYLPYMYVALGIVALAMSFIIAALLGRVARERLYVILPLALALILIVERALLVLNQSWIYPVLWLGMNVKGSLQGLFTWGLAGIVCDTRQAKRLFPLFGAGGILGAVVGGFSTRPLADWLHAENLLLIWAGTLLLAFLLGRALIGRFPGKGTSRRKRTRLIVEMQQGYQFVRRSPLMRWMSAAAVLFAVLFFALALPFSRAATQQFPAADALAGFLGLFQGVSTGVAFLVSLFLTNRLFARFGILRMMLGLPVIYLVGFGVLTTYATFPVLVVFRFIQALSSGIAGTAYQAVFNVVPPERRDQTRAFIDGAGPGRHDDRRPDSDCRRAGASTSTVVSSASAQQCWRQLSRGRHCVPTAAHCGVSARRQPHVFFTEEEPFGGSARCDGSSRRSRSPATPTR